MLITLDVPLAVVTLHIPEQLSDADVLVYTEQLAAKVRAQEPFGCIFRYLGGPPKKTKRGHAMENTWLKTYKAALGNYCFGLAIVESPGVQALLRKLVFASAGQKVFGCPCAQFTTDEAARAWLSAQRRAYIGSVEVTQ